MKEGLIQMKKKKTFYFLTTSATVGMLLFSAVPNEFHVHAATKSNPNAILIQIKILNQTMVMDMVI